MKFEVDIPFVRLLGFDLEEFDEGRSRIRYAPMADHCNAFGLTHGGVLMTLLDVTMASAARSVATTPHDSAATAPSTSANSAPSPRVAVSAPVRQAPRQSITIEMKTSFMQAARGALVCNGRLMHRTGSMAFTEATVLDEAGQSCAHATGTFKYTQPLRDATVIAQ